MNDVIVGYEAEKKNNQICHYKIYKTWIMKNMKEMCIYDELSMEIFSLYPELIQAAI